MKKFNKNLFNKFRANEKDPKKSYEIMQYIVFFLMTLVICLTLFLIKI